MNKHRNYFVIAIYALVLAVASAAPTFGQTRKDAAAAANTNPQLVDARQSGVWNVGIDETRNAVRLTNTDANPLAVKVIGSGPARKAFQFRMIVNPTSTGMQSQQIALPAGKRLVIENVSAIARCPDGLKMEMNFSTYLDNGDGVGDISDLTFHRIALTDQGTFDAVSIASANHKTLIFADEQIGNAHFGLILQARLNAILPPNAFAQAQVTFSGYVEDLPAIP
jgi:hypothetical protein